MKHTSTLCHKGFTLAEVLIALALLGVVAAFTIPKVMQTLGQQEAKTKLASTVGILEGLFDEDRRSGNFSAYYSVYPLNITNWQLNLYNVFEPRLNTLQKFPAALGTTHPCQNIPAGTGSFILPDGVLVSGLRQDNVFYDVTSKQQVVSGQYSAYNGILCIDINNFNTPNQFGQDIFLANFNLSGDFDSGGATFTRRLGGRGFNWGGKNQVVYDATGNPLSAPYDNPEYRVGYYLNN